MGHLTPTQLKARLDSGEPLTILDVREPWETALCSIAGSVHVPMAAVREALPRLPRDRDTVVVCHHGMRSLQVAQFLERAGYARVHNLTGGIEAWAQQVEPAMRRY